MTFGRGPYIRWLVVLTAVGFIPAVAVWESASAHTRGLMLAAYGVMVLGVGLLPELRIRKLLKHGAQTQGTVVDTKKGTAHGQNSMSITYHPVVEFTTADGRTVTFTSGLGFGHRPEIGGEVPAATVMRIPSRPRSTAPTPGCFPQRSGCWSGQGC